MEMPTNSDRRKRAFIGSRPCHALQLHAFFVRYKALAILMCCYTMLAVNCSNGVYHTQRKIESMNCLVGLGKILRNKVTQKPNEPLKEIASQITEFKHFRLSDCHTAKLEKGELIFLSDSKLPEITDLYISYIFSVNSGYVEVFILMPDLSIVSMFEIRVSRFQDWLANVAKHEQPTANEVKKLRDELLNEHFEKE